LSIRARVLQAIARLNYRPNKVARNLAARRSALIGVITFAVESYGPSHLIVSISQAARKLGYHLLLASAESPAMEEIRRCATELREHGVDGFIVILPTAQKLKALETEFGESPVVVMGTSRYHRYTAVEIDHEIGSRYATGYLISEGHREIACVNPKMPRRHHKIAPELAIRESVSRISTKPIRRKLGATTRRLANQSRQPAHNRGGESACSKLLKNEASSATLSSVERRRR
jgi:DNA-binding LacI/PurR family transcriptional regulator